MKKRLIPIGFGQALLVINVEELPEDIQKSFKEMYNGRYSNCNTIKNIRRTYS